MRKERTDIMSQKKKKSHSSGSYTGGKNPNRLQQTSKNKKMNPRARNLLCIDLVMLAANEWMVKESMISESGANMIAGFGVILLLAALYLQFGTGKKKGL